MFCTDGSREHATGDPLLSEDGNHSLSTSLEGRPNSVFRGNTIIVMQYGAQDDGVFLGLEELDCIQEVFPNIAAYFIQDVDPVRGLAEAPELLPDLHTQ